MNLLDRRHAAVATAGVLLSLVGATSVAAAPPWEGSTSIDAPAAPRLAPTWVDQSATIPHVSGGSSGPQIATWPTTSPVQGRGTQVIAALSQSGSVRTRTSTSILDAARYGRDRVLHLVAEPKGGKTQLGYRLGAADLSTLGRLERLGGPQQIVQPPQMAVSAAGAAVIAWTRSTGGRDEIQLTIKPRGGSFGPIETVKTTRVDDRAPVAVGIDAGGRAVVAYTLQSPAQISTRVIDTDDRKISPAEAITPASLAPGAAPVQLAVGASTTERDAPIVVAWDAYRASEDASPVAVGAAVIGSTSRRPGKATTLDQGAAAGYPRGPVVAAIDAGGSPVVSWTALPPAPASGTLDQRTTPGIPMVAQASADGAFATPARLDTYGAVGSIATAGAGVQIGYVRQDAAGQPVSVAAALRGAGPAFAAPEEIQAQPAPTSPGAPNPDYPAGLQPPGLAAAPGGGLLAVFTDVAPADASQSTTQVARRPTS